mgnify:CR=1 FL=1
MEAEAIKTIRRNKLFAGVLMLSMGVILILWPTDTLAAVAKVAGLFLMIYAVAGCIIFATGVKNGAAIVTVIIDIAGAILGLYLFLNPEWLLSVANKLFGVIILLHGIHSLYESVTVVRKLDTGWKSVAIFSIVIVLLGVFVILNPFAISDFIIRVIGIILIFNAMLAFYHMTKVRIIQEILEEE